MKLIAGKLRGCLHLLRVAFQGAQADTEAGLAEEAATAPGLPVSPPAFQLSQLPAGNVLNSEAA